MADKKILIVEDEDNIAIALEVVLRRDGYVMQRVADGSEAINAAKSFAPDLVLLDVMLPGASGYEICQQIRADDQLCDTRILIMTARGTAIERRKGLSLGADEFITKPFELAELRAQVSALLDKDRSDA